MVVIHGMSYEALAEATGCAVGTAKSRVFRARRQLEAWLLGEDKPAPRVSTRNARLIEAGGTKPASIQMSAPI